ncbi:MAG: 50S ribosomal protein L13 [bacterium]|nr:50S ribosomal protein L13 [bacterium]MDZ4248360.1 50S ribosomal protein L13 [Patescibacteria group bacterium]
MSAKTVTARTKTPVPTAADRVTRWFVADATGQILGRLSTRIARVLRGKDLPQFSAHVPTDTHVIVLNAGAVKVTGSKLEDKLYHRHGGRPGSLKTRTLAEQLERDPRVPLEHAVLGMLPDNRLKRIWRNHLHVYAGSEHEHAAQQPKELPND